MNPSAAARARLAKDGNVEADAHNRVSELESGLEALRVHYDQFFLGLTRHPPQQEHDLVKRAVLQLRNSSVRSTGVRFKINQLAQKLLSYERMWQRTLREIEDGTYRRDIFKAKLRRKASPDEQAAATEATQKLKTIEKRAATDDFEVTEDAEFAPPPAAAPAPISQPMRAAAPMPPPRPSPSGLSDDRIKAIYDAYLTAKKRCKENTQGITYESLASTLRKQLPSLMEKHNARAIEFKVVIKGGKAVLKAVPK